MSEARAWHKGFRRLTLYFVSLAFLYLAANMIAGIVYRFTEYRTFERYGIWVLDLERKIRAVARLGVAKAKRAERAEEPGE